MELTIVTFIHEVVCDYLDDAAHGMPYYAFLDCLCYDYDACRYGDCMWARPVIEEVMDLYGPDYQTCCSY